MSKDDYFNGEDYISIDSGIKDNNDYPSSNNDVSGSHHEETKENYPSGNSTIQETQVTQVPFSTSEIKMPFKSLSKFTFFSKKSAKKEAPLNNLAYDYTIPAIEKLEIIDKEKIKLEVEDRDRINRLENIDKTIEQAIKNRDQLEKDLEIARVAKDKSTSELIKAEQEFVDNLKTKFALIKQEKTLKKESIVKIEFILSKVDIMNVTSLDLSHSDINDFGAKFIADSLVKGDLPNLKHLDVSGNQISYEGNTKFAIGLQNMKQDIKILINKIIPIDTIISGAKKQSDLFFGSKEEKHAIIKDYLKHAQNNGIDIQKVVVSKSIFNKLENTLKLYFNFQVGFAKCNIVPEDATSFAAGAIVAKISKKATGVITATDAVACYFEVFDENASSQEGVQFMLDAGYINETDLLGNVE